MKTRFYLILAFEFILSPILYFLEFTKKTLSDAELIPTLKKRLEVEQSKVYVHIHEWGGYESIRRKKINNIPEFECGLSFQLKRFNKIKNQHPLQISLSISDMSRIDNVKILKDQVDLLYEVSNKGMDFSGYTYFFDTIKFEKNAYIILTNSSVNSIDTDFFEDYLHYMDQNKDVGMLGVSYSGKLRQTLIRNNFTPHLQSFFLLTTIDVLKAVVKRNGNIFPGSGIDHKLLLIRMGEVKLSQLVLKIGYNLAVVQENGEVYKFGINSWPDNGFKRWRLFRDDVRLISKNPNKIYEIS